MFTIIEMLLRGGIMEVSAQSCQVPYVPFGNAGLAEYGDGRRPAPSRGPGLLEEQWQREAFRPGRVFLSSFFFILWALFCWTVRMQLLRVQQ
jgi:hypothetical protein